MRELKSKLSGNSSQLAGEIHQLLRYVNNDELTWKNPLASQGEQVTTVTVIMTLNFIYLDVKFTQSMKGIFAKKIDTSDDLLDKYIEKFKSEAFEFRVIPVQKELSSYLSFTKVTKLYGIQAPTIQDLKQFVES
nr:15749_t:CDS:2 [Entrophospora candida]